MLDTTRRDVLDQGHTVAVGGLLVLLSAPHPEPRHWVHIRPGTAVVFGRAGVTGLGVLDARPDTPQDPTLSRRHARLALDDAGAYLVDLGSTNGTWLGGRRLASHVPTRLPNGATFQVGASRFAWLDGGARPAPQTKWGPAWLDRESFESACLSVLMRSQRYARPLALMVVSEESVPGGSVATGAPVWLRCVGRDDVLGYIGPDEWALLLPEQTLQAAHAVAYFIRATVQRQQAQDGGESRTGELRIGMTALVHDLPRTQFAGRADAGLAFDLDSVRLFLAAAREDRDAAGGESESSAIGQAVRAALAAAEETGGGAA